MTDHKSLPRLRAIASAFAFATLIGAGLAPPAAWAVDEFRMGAGTYTGNGGAGQVITGVGG